MVFCVTAACNDVKFRIPDLGDAPQPQPVIPAAVTVSFDQSVRTAVLEHQACADVAWKGPLGESIIQAFQKTGRARFVQMSVVDTAGETIEYTITVENTGNVDLTGVVLDDVFAGGATLVSGVAPLPSGISQDSLVVLLRNGNAYANVHTTAFPGGEIRGQFVKK